MGDLRAKVIRAMAMRMGLYITRCVAEGVKPEDVSLTGMAIYALDAETAVLRKAGVKRTAFEPTASMHVVDEYWETPSYVWRAMHDAATDALSSETE